MESLGGQISRKRFKDQPLGPYDINLPSNHLTRVARPDVVALTKDVIRDSFGL
jgi:hypothetical protein